MTCPPGGCWHQRLSPAARALYRDSPAGRQAEQSGPLVAHTCRAEHGSCFAAQVGHQGRSDQQTGQKEEAGR